MFGVGKHGCVGREGGLLGMVEVFRGVIGLRGVRLGGFNGGGGEGLKSVRVGVGGLEMEGYSDGEWGSVGAYPVGMEIVWDGEE